MYQNLDQRVLMYLCISLDQNTDGHLDTVRAHSHGWDPALTLKNAVSKKKRMF